jgi:hypothetical protein
VHHVEKEEVSLVVDSLLTLMINLEHKIAAAAAAAALALDLTVCCMLPHGVHITVMSYTPLLLTHMSRQ